MKIDYVVIAGYRHDLKFSRTCIASVRHWYPDMPVYFLKDEFFGNYCVEELQNVFGVRLLPTQRRRFSWGFSKLECLFDGPPGRFLVMDSDIIMAGPILEHLGEHTEDFIVQREDPSPEFVRSHAFDLDALSRLDPDFRFPNYTFNTGQWVGTSGIFSRADFDEWVLWHEPPRLRHPGVFQMGEQGLLNYFLQRQVQNGRCSLKRLRFMEVGDETRVAGIDLARVRTGDGYPFLIHWCGLRRDSFEHMHRGDLLEFFEDEYYAKVPRGRMKKEWRKSRLGVERWCRRLVRGIFPR
jgi:hypothetical protein